MGIIHKFTGNWPTDPNWDGARSRVYHAEGVAAVNETWLIGKAEGAENFAMRYYQVGVGGSSKREQHAHDNGILIISGEGEVLLGEEWHPISQGDVVYIPPDIEHQLVNRGETPMGFLCVIPARRKKQGETVWAEEKINFD